MKSEGTNNTHQEIQRNIYKDDREN
jgi:hypothetical protein